MGGEEDHHKYVVERWVRHEDRKILRPLKSQGFVT